MFKVTCLLWALNTGTARPCTSWEQRWTQSALPKPPRTQDGRRWGRGAVHLALEAPSGALEVAQFAIVVGHALGQEQ